MDPTKPINQNGLGTAYCVPYIKQADVAMLFFFEELSKEELKRNFEFYESFTVHESSFLHVYIPYKLLH
jgi:maltose phosphorylase